MASLRIPAFTEAEQRAFDAWLLNHLQKGYEIRGNNETEEVIIFDPKKKAVIAKHRLQDFHQP